MTEPPRYCAYRPCGKPLMRGLRESKADWSTRRFCSALCARRTIRKRPPRAVLLLLAVLLLGASAGAPRYDRAQWEHWIDADGDCQDTRQEVLIRDARPGTVQLDARGCRVVAGTWLDPYTRRIFTSPSLLDIDHLVPLFRAHTDGGWRWSREQRRAFANDLTYRWALVPVESGVNRQKGAQGPEAWKPPRQEMWCQYAQAWAAVKAKWRLEIRPDEAAALAEMLTAC